MCTTPAPTLIYRHWAIRPVTIPKTLDNLEEGVEALCWWEDPEGTMHSVLMHRKGPHPYVRNYGNAVRLIVACPSQMEVDEAAWKQAHNIKETYNSLHEVPDYRILCRVGTGELSEGRLLAFREGDQWHHRRSCSPEASGDDCWETVATSEITNHRHFATPYEAYREATPMGWDFPVVGKM